MVAFSWVKEVLDQMYPKANWEKGVDLNKDGKIQANEIISDFDNDDTVGSPQDWEKFRQVNTKTLQNQVRFFQSATESKLKADNPLHDVLAIEKHEVSDNQVEWVYMTVAKVLKKLRAGLKGAKTREEKLKLVYKAIQDSGFSIVDMSQSVLLSHDLNRTTIDCDTSAFIVLSVAHELGWPVHIVRASNTHVFVRWDDGHGNVLNIDKGTVRSDSEYMKNLSPQSVNRGFFMKNLSRTSIVAIAFQTVAVEITLLVRRTMQTLQHPMNSTDRAKNQETFEKQKSDALRFYDQAIVLDPLYILARINREQFLRTIRGTPQAR